MDQNIEFNCNTFTIQGTSKSYIQKINQLSDYLDQKVKDLEMYNRLAERESFFARATRGGNNVHFYFYGKIEITIEDQIEIKSIVSSKLKGLANIGYYFGRG